MKLKNKEKEVARFRSKLRKKTPQQQEKPSVKLLIIIVEGGKFDELGEILFSAGVRFDCVFKGTGTASSSLLNMLGLGTSSRDVVLATIDAHYAVETMELIYNLCKAVGIMISIKMQSVGGRGVLKMLQGDFVNENSKG